MSHREEQRQPGAERATEKGDEDEDAHEQTDDEAEIEPRDRQRCRVERRHQRAHRSLAANEAGERRIDERGLRAYRLGVRPGQPAIDALDNAMPVAQQKKRDDGRDEDEGKDIEERQAAAQRALKQPTGPREGIAQLDADGVAQLGVILGRQAFLKEPHQ